MQSSKKSLFCLFSFAEPFSDLVLFCWACFSLFFSLLLFFSLISYLLSLISYLLSLISYLLSLSANQWLPVTYFPSGIGRGNLASTYFDGKAYFAGGATATRFTDAIDIYDPVTKSWVVSPAACCGAHNYDDVPRCKTSLADPRCETIRLSQPRSNPFMTILEYRPNINYKPNKQKIQSGASHVASSAACTAAHDCVKQFEEMLVVVGGLTGGSSSRWFFEATSMASPRIDFIKGTHSYWKDVQGAVETDGTLYGVSTEARTEHFMHDVMSRGMMDGNVMAVNGKLHLTGGRTNLHLPSLRMEVLTWKSPFICTSISRDNDMCAFTDMERIKPGVAAPVKPTCDYQFLPKFKPWFCPCPNIRGVSDKGKDPMNFDKECASGTTLAKDSNDDTDQVSFILFIFCCKKTIVQTCSYNFSLFMLLTFYLIFFFFIIFVCSRCSIPFSFF